MKRLLVVKLAALGDLLTTTPALRALRLRFPEARIDALVTPGTAPLLAGLDSVDRVIRFDKFAFDRPSGAALALPRALILAARLRAGRYDTVVLLHHLTTFFGRRKYAGLALASGAPRRVGLDNGHGWFLTERAPDEGFGVRHEVEYWLSVVGVLGAHHPAPRLELAVPPEAEAAAARRWRQAGLAGRDTVLLQPGSGGFSLARRWKPERFVAVGERLRRERGLALAVLAGPGPGEVELAQYVQQALGGQAAVLSGIASVQELAALLRRCRLVIGNDSGVIHVAAAMETPVVAIFGPTNHRAWGPYPPDAPRNVVVRELIACSPCIHRGHDFGRPAGCPARTCLEIVTVDQVYAAALAALAAEGPTAGATVAQSAAARAGS
jgi:heptosyltransferase-2